MNARYDNLEPEESRSGDAARGFGKRLGIVLLLAFAAAAVLHLYRYNQLPLFQQPLPGFDHALNGSSGTPQDPAASGTRTAPQPGVSAAGAAWVRQDLATLSVEAPFPLGAQRPTHEGLTPYQVKQLVTEYDWAARAADGFQVEVIYFQIDGRRTLSLEDGVRGPVRHFAKELGDPDPAYGKVDGWINGLAARHISYRYPVNGTNRHLEELFIQNTRSVMGVVVTFTGDARVGDAQRVLASVQVRLGN